MPSRLIHQQHGMGTGRDGKRYLGKMERHGFGIAEWQHQPRALAKFGTDRAEDVGRFRPLVLRGRWPCPASGPAPRDLVFLADAGFVLEPDFYRCAVREGSFDLCQCGGKAPFLKAMLHLATPTPKGSVS